MFLHQAVVPTSHCQSIGFLVLISAESQVGDSVAVRASLVDPRGGLSGIGRMEGIQNIIHRPWRVVFVLPFSFSFFDCFFLADVPVQPGYLWRKKKTMEGGKRTNGHVETVISHPRVGGNLAASGHKQTFHGGFCSVSLLDQQAEPGSRDFGWRG